MHIDLDAAVLLIGIAFVAIALCGFSAPGTRHYGDPTTDPPPPRNPNKPPPKALRPVDSIIVHRERGPATPLRAAPAPPPRKPPPDDWQSRR